MQVKTIEATGIAGVDGQLRRGDRLCSVNGCALSGATRQEALQMLKNSGNTVILEIARQVTSSRTKSTQVINQ